MSIVTIREGVELLPQAAFLSSALRSLGFEPRLVPTDFCTSREAFQTEVRRAPGAPVVFVDGVEWREIVVTLSECACEAGDAPVLVITSLADHPDGADFPDRVRFVRDGDFDALARALGAAPAGIAAADVGLDYGVFGGAALLRSAMGCSLFGDLGSAALVARRPLPAECSPTAALARLEAPAGVAPVTLAREAALAPLAGLGGATLAVEWWDRSLGTEAEELLRAVAARGLRQSVRLLPGEAAGERLRRLAALGVARVVFECDALEGAASPRIPGAAGAASEIAPAVARVRDLGLEAGVLFVVGLPGEGAAAAEKRRAILSAARPDRIRVVPFEPAGGSEAWSWCAARRLWPPADNRWNRELYQPLAQPESGDWAHVLEGALLLVAETAA